MINLIIKNKNTINISNTNKFASILSLVSPTLGTIRFINHSASSSRQIENIESSVASHSNSLPLQDSLNENPTSDITVQKNYADIDRKSTRLNSSHSGESRMPSSA